MLDKNKHKHAWLVRKFLEKSSRRTGKKNHAKFDEKNVPVYHRILCLGVKGHRVEIHSGRKMWD